MFHFLPPVSQCRDARWLCSLLLIGLLASRPHLWAAEATSERRTFNLPGGDAIETLKHAARQAGIEIMFPADTVRGVKTNAVRGELTPREALGRMVANTPLTVVQDEKTGALTITRVAREPPPEAAAHANADPPLSNPPMKNKPARWFGGLLAGLALPSLHSAEVSHADADQTVRLDAFTITSDQDRGYRASNAIGATRTNTPIADTPAVDQRFQRPLHRGFGFVRSHAADLF